MAHSESNRWRGKLFRIFLPVGLLAGLTTLLMGSGVPGPQSQVNTFTAGAQRMPAVAMDPAGNSVVAWTSSGQDGDGDGVFAQRFDATGHPAGSEFQVNTSTAGEQSNPAAAMDAGGNFVIAWTSYAQDGSGFGVFGQRYNADGSPQGPEFQVNFTTTGDQSNPAVAINAQGSFVIAWTSGPGVPDAVFAQRFDADGTGHGEFQVNGTAGDILDQPGVAMDAAGDFVVAWAVNPIGLFVQSVLARRYDSSGVDLGGEFQVNASGGARNPAVGMDQAGNFAVAWQAASIVRAQRFGASGARLGAEFQVNTASSRGERPALAMTPTGSLVVTGLFDDGEDPHIFAQCYDATGTPQGDELQVNDPATSVPARQNPAAGMDATGNFVIAWTGSDGSSQGVFARRYTAVVPGISLSIDDVSVVEGDSGTTDAIFTVSLSAASTDSVMVNFATADGTAIAGVVDDYQADSGMLMFAPGEISKQIVVRVYGDRLSEDDETFFVNLSNAGNASILRGRGFGTILNDDFTLSVSDVTVTEGHSGTVAAVFSVGLSGSSTATVSVDFATADGTATVSDNDYATNSGTLTFTAGQTSKQVTVLVNGDTRNEFDETFFVNLRNPANAAIADGQGVGKIRNDDFGATVAGNQFQVNFTFFGNQFQPAIGMNAAGSFVIAWTSSDVQFGPTRIFAQRFDARGIIQGPELRVDDPAFVSGQQTKPAVAMDAAGNFVVVWNGGNITAAGTDPDAPCSTCQIYAQRFDASGTRVGPNFQVNASTPGASLRDHPSVGMYASGEFVVAWAAFGAPPPLGSGIGVFARLFDATGNPSGSEFQVHTFTPGGRSNPVVAVSPADCVIPPGSPLPGSCTLQDFVIVWEGAGSDDSAGVFARRFDSGGNPIGDQFRINMYTDNLQERPAVGMDAAGSFVVAWEGEGVPFPSGPVVRGIFAQRFDPNGAPMGWCNPVPPGPGPFGCTISDLLVNTSTTGVHRPSVGVGHSGGFVIAWDGFEDTTSSNSAIFTRSFDRFGVPRGGDEFLVNQTFPLGESDPGARMDAAGNFVIAWTGTDSSISGVFARRFAADPTISINDVRENEGDSGTKNWIFTVTLSAASTQTVTVDFGTADGTASVADNDYSGTAGTLTFAPGDTSKTISVTVNGDTVFEPDETFFVDLSNPTNAMIARARGVGTILNDDCALSLSINDVTLAEGNSGAASAAFTVNLSCPSSLTVSVDFATADGTASTADNDYGAQSGTLTFAPGETSKQITVLVNGDTTIEPDETFFVNLTNAINAAIAKIRGTGTITNDDAVQIVVNETITVADEPQVEPADRTPPVIAPDVRGTLGSNGWFTSDVLVTWSVTDPESAISTWSGCGPASVTSDTGGATFTCTATSAGGPASNSVTIKRDTTRPSIVITTPSIGAVYVLNENASYLYSCADNLGLAICNHVSNLDTSSVGTKTFTVNAADYAGNTNSQSVSYSVINPCHYASIALTPSTVRQGGQITVTATLRSCANTTQRVAIKFTLDGPLQSRSCAISKSLMFTTPPFSLPPNTLRSVSFPFRVPTGTCPGTYSVTTTTLVNGASVDTSSTALTVTPR